MRPRWNLETFLALCSLPIIYSLVSQLHLMLLQGAPEPARTSWDHSSSTEQQVTALSDSLEFPDCVQEECIRTMAAAFSRAWEQRPISSWCHSDYSTLMLIKVPKSASSTVTSMVLRLGRAYNCSVSWQHGTAREKQIHPTNNNNNTRQRRSSFVLAPIRLPYTRALSDVYFHKVTFHAAPRMMTRNRQPGDSFLKTQIDQVPANFILEYTRVTSDNNMNSSSSLPTAVRDLHATIRDMMMSYDFLLVVERMEESMVVLAWILNVPVTALLTFSSKQADSWYLVGGKGNKPKCVRLVRPVLTPAIEAHVNANKWKRRNLGDLLLHAVAFDSLDKTIDLIGRTFVMQQVEQLREMNTRLQTVCANQTYFPCSNSGQPQLELARESCIERDFGCGYQCMDRLFARNESD